MDGGTPMPLLATSTRTSLKIMFVTTEAAPAGRSAMPSKLKVLAALSVTEVVSVALFARFCHVTVRAKSREQRDAYDLGDGQRGEHF